MSQKTDSIIKLGLVFFVSLLSFSIGTYVGKKYSDNQHKLSLLEPKNDSHKAGSEEGTHGSPAEAKAAPPHAGADEELAAEGHEQKPAALTDSEVAKIAEEFANEPNELAEEKLVGTIDPDERDVKVISDSGKNLAKPARLAHAPAKEAIKEPVHVAAAKAPEKTPEERTPASLPPKAESKAEIQPIHFTVQVGSYPTAQEAEKLTKDLIGKGYKTTFVPAKINGQTWYRVHVGLFGTVKEAQDYKKEFLEKTRLSSAIVQRVQN